jgi:hypothetical protein
MFFISGFRIGPLREPSGMTLDYTAYPGEFRAMPPKASSSFSRHA